MCSDKRAGSTGLTGDHAEFDLGVIAGVTDRGHLHAHNEDAIALGTRDRVSAAVVCDGVSSTRNPERASLAATDAALGVLLAATETAPEQRVRDAIAAATDAVHALAPPGSNDDPSCTIVAALVSETESGRPTIAVAWIGDSRAYWLAGPDAAEPARRLTEDHSWASEVVAAGLLDEEAAQAHPRAHIITRWLGPRDDHKPGVTILSPAGPGALLLCSDGLWNYYPEATDLADLASPVLGAEPGSPEANAAPNTAALRTASAMTTLALDAGGRDNITVAVLPVP
ncbi:PP2C family protein-serine/threonine phosphatase [Pseudonocardia spinosispora]|uniref:PP2C family protein-serine/threonine phosphatase n=1 Tax=Pseudonocardia spinosispora TaxID=103441 RepID=UPI00042A7055|nr:protein phosphatase 2C domain-containing protein [Pseudonocardia spinosispora]